MERPGRIDKERVAAKRAYILHVLELRWPGQVTAGLIESVESESDSMKLSHWFDSAVTAWSMVDFLIEAKIGAAGYFFTRDGRRCPG